MSNPFTTHEVLNQSPPFENVNLFTSDKVLMEAVERESGKEAIDRLTAFGKTCGSAEAFERGRLANENPPRLRTFDSKGRRLDVVEFHPAYHECMATSMTAGLHCSVWEHVASGSGPVAGANVARSAGCYLAIQMEAGHQCPITMTNASVPTLLLQPDLARLQITLQDRPGALYKVMHLFNQHNVNILEIYHQRIFTNLPAKGLVTDIECEARDREQLEALISALRGQGYSVSHVELN